MNEYLMTRATDCPLCAGTEQIVYSTKRIAGSCKPCPKCVPRDSDGWFRAGKYGMSEHHQCSLLVAHGYAAWVDTYLAPIVESMWAKDFNTMFGCQGGGPSKNWPGGMVKLGYLMGVYTDGWLEHLRTLIDPARYVVIDHDWFGGEGKDAYNGNKTILVRWEGSLAP